MEVPDKAGNGVRGLGEPLGSIYFENWYKSFVSILTLSQSLKNEFCLDLPMLSKYPATSVNSFFYKMTLCVLTCQ